MKALSRNFAAVLVASVMLAFAACSPREQKITIISVNDMHGGIDNFPALATLVGKYRAADSARTLLIDAGDRWTGNPYVDLDAERGKPMIDLMNALGFDLSTFGNHEFDFGLDILAKRVGESEFPYVCANINSNGSALPQPEPYRCINVKGIKICFLGLITTARGGYPDGFVENFGGIIFSNPIASALEYRSLRDECDVLVGLTHIGYELDSVLAGQMPGMDLIIGGHTHTVIPEGRKVGGATLTQGGSRLKYAGVTTITMRGRKVASVENSLVRLDTVAPDPRFSAMVAEYKNNAELRTKFGVLANGLDKTGVMNLVSDIVRKRVGADMAIYNWGGIRVDSLAAGPLTLVDAYSMEPFGNSACVLKMSLAQIRELILNKFNSTGSESHVIDLYPSGFRYRIITDANGNGVGVEIETPAKPSPEGLYDVAMTDYVQSTYNFSAAGSGAMTGYVIAPTVIEYFRENSPVTGDNAPRVSIGR